MQYPEFLKKHIVRLDSQFTKPPMTPKGKLVLPFGSVYHTYAEGTGVFGQDDDILKAYKGEITVQNILGLHSNVEHGKLRIRAYSKDQLIMDFNKHNKQFEFFKSAESRLAKTPKLLHVVNYGNMLHQVTQLEEPLMEFHAYMNYWRSFFHYLSEIVGKDKRQHFFKIEAPLIVPPKSVLDRVKEQPLLNLTELGYFTDNLQLFVLDIWRFMQQDNPETYSLSMLGLVPPEDLERVHMVMDVGSQYAIINLGLVSHWIQSEKNPKGRWKAEEAQKRLLKLFIGLADLRTNTRAAEVDIEDMEDELSQALGEDDASADLGFEIEQAEKKLEEANFEVAEVKKPKGGFYKNRDQKTSVSSQPNLVASIRDIIEQDNVSEFLSDTSIEDDLEAETKAPEEVSDEAIDKLEEIQEAAIKNSQVGNYVAYTPSSSTLDDVVKKKAREVAAKGLLTSAELRRYEKLSNAWEEIKAPNGQSMVDYLKINPEDKKIEGDTPIASAMNSVLDETFLQSSLKKLDKVYIEKFMDKHVHAMVINSLQREGIVVKDIKRTHVKTLMDDYYQYSVKVIPVVGQESTFSFKIPRVTADGTMQARNVKIRMRKQRADLPIRKLSPEKVAMTSYHSKLFVSRSPRMTNNYDKWIAKKIYEGTLLEPAQVTDLVYGAVFDPDLRSPRPHSSIGKVYTSFRTGDKQQYHLNFDPKTFKPEDIAEHKIKKGEQPCGHVNGKLIVIDDLGILTWVKGEERGIIGLLESLIGVPDDAKRPVGMIDVGPIAGGEIPLGFLLGYYIGLGNMLETLKIKHRRVNKGQRMDLKGNEFAIRFADQTLIIESNSPINTMLINGFNRYKNEIANFSVWDFDKRDGYLSVFDLNDIRTRHVQRIDQVRNNWIDPITEDILIEMQYPIDMVLLLIEAAKLLEYDDHPDENDITYSRARGYERVSGLVYGNIMTALSTFNSRPNNPNAKLSMNPEEVWYAVTTDQTTAPVDDSNPIQSMKDRSVVVFSGAGGRSGQTMTAKHRRFHKSGVGIISSDTVDSGDVATITYLSSNPQFNSIYGTTGKLDKPNENAAATFSESALLCPGAKYDDPKRINFLNIQNSSTTHCVGYKLMPCRTGFEKTVAQRSGDIFSATALGNGVVEFLSKDTIRIAYDDGSTASYQIGRRYGNWSGKVIPHSLKTDLKVGDKVKENDILYYNELFFTEDPFSKEGDVSLKWGALAKVVFGEFRETLEDGSGISADFAKELITTDCKTKYVTINFDEEVRNLLPINSKVDDDSILCTILPPSSESLSQFADSAASVLQRVTTNSPRVKFNGVIEQYRVYYCGDETEMSPSLALLVEQSNDEIMALNRRMKEPMADGQVMIGTRINGKPIAKNTAVLEVRMNGHLAMKPGDKLVVGGQMKSIVGEIYEEAPMAEDGSEVGVVFSLAGVFNRMVQSALLMGAINTTMLRADKEFVNLFFGESD